jgi:hypothetical protein
MPTNGKEGVIGSSRMLGLALEGHFFAAATSRFGCYGSAMEAGELTR